MSLSEYQRKRRFNKTTEPQADIQTRQRSIFVVQLHHASHRHYDLRLQIGGTLKSWAVPKGPSLDPSVKRLAVEVEDHPISYAKFEGEIPAGEYGAGHVAIFDHGVWSSEEDTAQQLAKGHLRFTLFGKYLQGKWSLVKSRRHGRQPAWFLIKQSDVFAGDKEADDFLSAVDDKKKRSVPDPRITTQIKNHPKSHAAKLKQEAFAPLLCKSETMPPKGQEWLHEIKWDGYRLLCTVVNSEPKLWSRNGQDWTSRLPDIVYAIRNLGVNNAAFDGELAALKGIRSHFSLLQATLSGRVQAPLTYMIFDLLYYDGYDISRVELADRKYWLEKILENSPGVLRYSAHLQGNGQDMMSYIAREKLEGVISKRVNSPYRPGRNPNWQKIKFQSSDDFAIAGFIEPKGSRVGIGSLLLARFDRKDGWILAGRVGTGINDEMLDTLSSMLRPKATRKPSINIDNVESDLRNAWWVKPKHIVEVFYRGLSSQELLRHTAFKSLRLDKTLEDLIGVRRGEHNMSKDRINISSPERIVFPGLDITKLDVITYYEGVMPWLLPELLGRPLSVLRCPEGRQGNCFFQKHHTPGLNVNTVLVNEKKGTKENYLVVHEERDILQLAQFNVLEFHPWGSMADNLSNCDRLVFDLDPSDDAKWADVKQAARKIYQLLNDLGLQSFLRTSGGKGLHVVVPLNPSIPWETAKEFSRAFAKTLAIAFPDKYVATASKAQRTGKIFVDYLRNSRGATSICSYSLRARPGAPIATPLRWDELSRLKSASAYDIKSLPRRLSRLKGDPWGGIAEIRQGLPSELNNKPLSTNN